MFCQYYISIYFSLIKTSTNHQMLFEILLSILHATTSVVVMVLSINGNQKRIIQYFDVDIFSYMIAASVISTMFFTILAYRPNILSCEVHRLVELFLAILVGNGFYYGVNIIQDDVLHYMMPEIGEYLISNAVMFILQLLFGSMLRTRLSTERIQGMISLV